MTIAKIQEFTRDRVEALLSLDLDKIRAFGRKHGFYLPEDDEHVLVAAHKARTAVHDLPIEARRESKAWLDERGHSSMDWGDL